MVVVAAVTHALLPGMPWAVCFVLGAIVSPPDAVAVTASTRRLGLPRTTLVVLEGESLMNDATALVAYQIALTAAVTGTFSLSHASIEFVLTSAGGIAIGLGMAWCVGWVRVHITRSSVVENTISLLSPFIAFIPANAAGCSGVLAVVAMGLYLGRRGPRVVTAETRLQGTAMWEVLTFLLEGMIFIFIGLQLPQVLKELESGEIYKLTGVSIAIAVAMVVTRMLWIFPSAYLSHWIEGRLRRAKSSYPPWRHILFAGWAGIRGGDSLVIALALPYAGAHGIPLAGRAAVIFITFGVILVTLVAQGFTLAPLIRALGIVGDTSDDEEEQVARKTSIRAGAAAVESDGGGDELESATRNELHEFATQQLERLEWSQPELASRLSLRLAMIAAEREAVIAMRDRSEISDTVMRRLQKEFDHEETLLHQRYGK